MTSGSFIIDYTMFNLPYRMAQGALITSLEYSAGRERIVKAGTTGVRLYVGQLYERFTPKTPTSTTGDVQHVYRVLRVVGRSHRCSGSRWPEAPSRPTRTTYLLRRSPRLDSRHHRLQG